MLAYDYPLLDVFVSMVFLILFVVWLVLLIHILGDLFRDRELGGVSKALWIVFLVVLPYIGVLTYIVMRGSGMGLRELERAQAHDDMIKAYALSTVAGLGPADELAKLADLRDRGVLSEDEFNQQKAKVLS
jgi:Short C-terminal domain/Phospholipase_D-nuclease N-terminal